MLGFRPKDNPYTADFPATVYTFYTRDDVRGLLIGVGFAEVELSEPVPGFILARAVKQS